jgi:hypothetical protein
MAAVPVSDRDLGARSIVALRSVRICHSAAASAPTVPMPASQVGRSPSWTLTVSAWLTRAAGLCDFGAPGLAVIAEPGIDERLVERGAADGARGHLSHDLGNLVPAGLDELLEEMQVLPGVAGRDGQHHLLAVDAIPMPCPCIGRQAAARWPGFRAARA